MGYQVGLTCYATKAEAENAYFSMVPPSVQNGELHQLQWTPVGWQFKGQIVQAYLPECSVIESFKDGQLIGWSVFAILAAVWSVRLIRERLRL